MASDLSKYYGNKFCQYAASGADMPDLTGGLFIALFDGDPKGAGTEVTTTIRVAGRVAANWDSIADDGTDVAITSDADADFGAAAGGASVSHVALMDAASSGNVFASHALTGGTATITTGTPVKVLSGDLNFTIGS